MTSEEKLDIALDFLASNNAGSYLTPGKILFFEHLAKEGIQENEHLPILLHLVWGEYVSAYYEDNQAKTRGEYPTQIKITFKGIKFREKGGYKQNLIDEREEREDIRTNRRLAVSWSMRATIEVWGAAIAAPAFLAWDIYKYFDVAPKEGDYIMRHYGIFF